LRHVAGGQREGMKPQSLGGFREQAGTVGHGQRRQRIFADPGAFEGIAALDDLALEIAGLARSTAEIFEPVETMLDLVITDAPILELQFLETGRAIALGQMRLEL